VTRFLCIVCFLFCLPAFARGQGKIQLRSPDGNLDFSFQLQQGRAAYQVVFKGKIIVDNSALDLEFPDGGFIDKNVQLLHPVYREAVEDYELVIGKTKHVHAPYKEVTVPIQQISTSHRQINLVVRMFDDGVAFRYEFPSQEGWRSFTLRDELTTFNLAGNPVVHALFLPGYTTSHEGLYSAMPLRQVKEDSLMDIPSLFEFPGPVFLAITEAALLDYAGMYLSKHKGVLTSKLSPLPDQEQIKVIGTLPHKSPWRVLMISDRVGALIESNIITSLNEPSRIKDVSWIHPGKSTWSWWNGHVVPDTLKGAGMNFVTARYYIDFCSRHGIDYHSVTDYGEHQWYVDDGVGLMPGPHSDVTTPVAGLNMKEICDYAKRKGVGIRVWVHWAALYPKLDTAFALFEKWGIRGLMVDFMDRDDQRMVNIQTDILEKAAAHHLHIQFHGAYKPTGLSRTYPNEFTREGTLNYEADKWDEKGISPDHDINIPFTRMLAGSTDYHLGGFRAVPEEKFKAQFIKPLVLGTRCHMLAMYVVLENELPLVCDYPAAYEGEPGFDFIEDVPSTWDETKVLDAKVGEYVVIARRRNEDWYVGAIANHNARQLSVSLTFLKEGKYHLDLYTDAQDARQNPNHLTTQNKGVTRDVLISFKMASGGGAVMRLRKSHTD
jgi:alpha-glucosidase